LLFYFLGKFTFVIFNGYNNNNTKMKNFHKSHMHNSGYEPVSLSNMNPIANDGINGYHGRAQHFKYGAVSTLCNFDVVVIVN